MVRPSASGAELVLGTMPRSRWFGMKWSFEAMEFLRLADEIPVRTEVEVLALEQANEALTKVKRSEVRGSVVLQVA